MKSNGKVRIAIACGGTGGHLFPGLAVADALSARGCEVDLLISQKEVDQEAVKSAAGLGIVALPAVALQNGAWGEFAGGFWQSYRLCQRVFKNQRPHAVLAMGGFTSAPPVLSGKRLGAATFLHEANAIPGRANRWLAPWVEAVFVAYESAGRRLHNQTVHDVGMPVRPQFKPMDPVPCRMALGLRAQDPVVLVVGGSQGASAINQLIARALPLFATQFRNLQFLHLAGMNEVDVLSAAYQKAGLRAIVRPFLTEMDLALGAATLAVSRAGASSIAEFAAMGVPPIFIPYPAAVDNHQYYNAQPLREAGAAQLFEQSNLTPEVLARAVMELMGNELSRRRMSGQLKRWHRPDAADQIAVRVLEAACQRAGWPVNPDSTIVRRVIEPETDLQPLIRS